MKKVEKAQTKVSQAKAEFVPDVTLSAGYGQKGYRAPQEPYMATVESQDVTGSPGYPAIFALWKGRLLPRQ